MKHEMNQMQVRSLPWIAGGLLLVNLLLNILRSVQATGRFFPSLSMAVTLFLVVSLFLMRRNDLIPVALILALLSSLSASFQNFLLSWDLSILFNWLPLAVLLLLALPSLQQKTRFLWALPAILDALLFLIPLFDRLLRNNQTGNLFYALTQSIHVYACFFFGLWLAYPSMTIRQLIQKGWNTPDIYTFGFIYCRGMLIGVLFGIPFLILSALVGGVFYQGRNAFLIPLFLIFAPAVLFPLSFMIITLNEGRKATKQLQHNLNTINANSNIPGVSDQARAALRKETARAAQKEVIKSAVIGSVIAGDTGAVVGAVSAKAKQDTAASGGTATGKQAQKAVIKGAVVGGIVAGDAGAIVGAVTAKAGQDAGSQSKK